MLAYSQVLSAMQDGRLSILLGCETNFAKPGCRPLCLRFTRAVAQAVRHFDILTMKQSMYANSTMSEILRVCVPSAPGEDRQSRGLCMRFQYCISR